MVSILFIVLTTHAVFVCMYIRGMHVTMHVLVCVRMRVIACTHQCIASAFAFKWERAFCTVAFERNVVGCICISKTPICIKNQMLWHMAVLIYHMKPTNSTRLCFPHHIANMIYKRRKKAIGFSTIESMYH